MKVCSSVPPALKTTYQPAATFRSAGVNRASRERYSTPAAFAPQFTDGNGRIRPTRMAAEVPTLKDMKALSVSKQAQLLLRRLATLYPNSQSSFGKRNLNMQATDLPVPEGRPNSHANAKARADVYAPRPAPQSDAVCARARARPR